MSKYRSSLPFGARGPRMLLSGYEMIYLLHKEYRHLQSTPNPSNLPRIRRFGQICQQILPWWLSLLSFVLALRARCVTYRARLILCAIKYDTPKRLTSQNQALHATILSLINIQRWNKYKVSLASGKWINNLEFLYSWIVRRFLDDSTNCIDDRVNCDLVDARCYGWGWVLEDIFFCSLVHSYPIYWNVTTMAIVTPIPTPIPHTYTNPADRQIVNIIIAHQHQDIAHHVWISVRVCAAARQRARPFCAHSRDQQAGHPCH